MYMCTSINEFMKTEKRTNRVQSRFLVGGELPGLVQLCGDLRSVNTISLPFHENASRGEGVTSLKVRGSRLEWKYRLIFFRARYNP